MNYESQEFNISEDQLSANIGSIDGIDKLTLWNIQTLPSGHGHRKIKVHLILDGVDYKYTVTTSNMPMTDAWRGGEEYISENDNFDSWDDVVSSMLDAIDIEFYADRYLDSI